MPSIEIKTETGMKDDYKVFVGNTLLESFEVGDIKAKAFCDLLIMRKKEQGYENAHNETWNQN